MKFLKETLINPVNEMKRETRRIQPPGSDKEANTALLSDSLVQPTKQRFLDFLHPQSNFGPDRKAIQQWNP